MSSATPSSITANGNEMSCVEPSEESPAENERNSDKELTLKERKPSWFCKLVVSRPLSVFGMLLCC